MNVGKRADLNPLVLFILVCVATANGQKFRILMDIHNLRMVGSAGLQISYTLLCCQKLLQREGGDIVLVNGLGRRSDPILIAKMAANFRICRSKDDAIAFLM